ncbi:MAG: sensor domain-containing diguanylate cyclase, partial [Candidatus Omnitrophica bacterium]|nr:sensor domain-containing diguanylate cyclase [Candidatus Omnitrophota bacterium]
YILPMAELIKTNEELERAKKELAILYEISNAMRTTLKLDEILYIILTGVTAHIGLSFNRAILFLSNEKNNLIEGKMAIGPENGDEANRIWTRIETEKTTLDDLINAYKFSASRFDSGFNQMIRHFKIPLNESEGGLLALCVLDSMPLHLTKDNISSHPNDPVLRLLKTEEVAIVPLKAKDKVNGIIVADNFITKKGITKDDLHMLIMLANQAGLAIENSQLYEKTVVRTHQDSLTSLWNHGYFQFLLQEELEKAKASKTPLSLVAIDIDDFKVYNDNFGHQAGDKILKDLAGILKGYSRQMDSVCRYGGEEFTIILPQTNKEEAYLIAERLRQTIEKYPFTHEEIMPHQRLTVSVGLSTFPEDGTTPAQLLHYSDKTLYQAKRSGKNNTCKLIFFNNDTNP